MDQRSPRDRSPEVSVVIPVRNAAAVVAFQLDSLERQECELAWEVVVVDDGSTDGTADVVRRYTGRLPGLRMIPHPGPHGAAAARNAGAGAAAAPAVLFLDADDTTSTNYVQVLGTALRSHGLVCPIVDFRALNDAAAVAVSPRPQPDRPYQMFGFLPHAGGGGLGIRRTVFDALDGFDPSLPWLHDADLCWRAQLRLGEELHVAGDAVSHVRLRSSLGGLYRQGVANGRDGMRLRHRYAAHGVPWTPWSRHLRQWLKTVRALGRSATAAGRHEFAWRLGKQVGRFQGLVTDGR